MGSCEMAAKVWLLTLLVVSAWLVAGAQDEINNEINDEVGDKNEDVIKPISEERRRERLRSFFTRRREESLKSAEEESPKESTSQRPRNRFIRPRVTSPKPVEEEDDDDLEGFSTEKVSVSISKSVSTSVSRRVKPITRIFNRRKEEQTKTEEEDKASVEVEDEESKEEIPKGNRFTQRKRFRLFKTPASRNRDRGSIVEKVLENIDKQNEIETEDRRVRFRPSIRRENIRKKVQEAVGSEEQLDQRPKPRIRLPGQTRERLTTVIAPTTTEQYVVTLPEPEPIEIVTEPIVSEVETLPPLPQLLDEATLAPATVGFFPTLPTFIPTISEEPVQTTTTTTTAPTTTQSPRANLFRRKGPKRFRPVIKEEEINEITDEAPKANNRIRFKRPRKLPRFRPSESAVRRRPVTEAPLTTEPEIVTTAAPIRTTSELPATTTQGFTFFGLDSSPTPSTIRQLEVKKEQPVRLF